MKIQVQTCLGELTLETGGNANSTDVLDMVREMAKHEAEGRWYGMGKVVEAMSSGQTTLHQRSRTPVMTHRTPMKMSLHGLAYKLATLNPHAFIVELTKTKRRKVRLRMDAFAMTREEQLAAAATPVRDKLYSCAKHRVMFGECRACGEDLKRLEERNAADDKAFEEYAEKEKAREAREAMVMGKDARELVKRGRR